MKKTKVIITLPLLSLKASLLLGSPSSYITYNNVVVGIFDPTADSGSGGADSASRLRDY